MVNILSVVIAALALFVAVAVYVGQSRRTDFEAARLLHLDLTSGEVAEARRLLGTLRYGNLTQQDAVGTGEALTAYFTLLWCFERIAAGRRAMLAGRLNGRPGRAVRFLDEVIKWHLIEWRVGLPVAKECLSARMQSSVDDGQSLVAIKQLLEDLGVENMQDV